MFSAKIFTLFLIFLLNQRITGSPTFLSYGEHLGPKIFIQDDLRSNKGEIDNEEDWCDPVLGCLSMSDDWKGPTRPINLKPDSRVHINTRFYLNTRLSPDTYTDYTVSADDLTSLAKSTFNVTKPTKFIVHGYIDTGDVVWMKDLASDLLAYGDYNVIRVDWSDGSREMYAHCTANTRVVGLEIGHFVNTLVRTWSLDPSNVHCIGHSLGAHACGYGGEQIDKMGRITGLDPAGPYFTGTPDFVHLDPSDAVFVDNIHTDADPIWVLGFGTPEPMGNLDFYPNSGADQPGCDPSSVIKEILSRGEDIRDGARDIFACNHLRSIKFFQESLNSPDCQWIGQECQDYETFQQGGCYSCGSDGAHCAFMGMRADEYLSKGRKFAAFYLDTDKEPPFCMQQYAVSVLTADPEQAEDWVIGKIFLTIYGDTSQILEKVEITRKKQKIVHGELLTSFFTSHVNVGHALRIEVKWVYDDKALRPGTYCYFPFCNRSLYVQSVQLSPINYYPQSLRMRYASLACDPSGSFAEVKDRDTVSFMTEGSCQVIGE